MYNELMICFISLSYLHSDKSPLTKKGWQKNKQQAKAATTATIPLSVEAFIFNMYDEIMKPTFLQCANLQFVLFHCHSFIRIRVPSRWSDGQRINSRQKLQLSHYYWFWQKDKQHAKTATISLFLVLGKG